MFIFDVYWTTFYFLGCMLKFRLPNLYTITRVSKIKKRLLKKEKVKDFFIFMTILSFKQVEYNHSKKKPCKQGCSSIIKFSHCLSFEYCKYGFIYLFIYLFIYFSTWTQNGCTCCMHKEKNLWSEQVWESHFLAILKAKNSKISPLHESWLCLTKKMTLVNS